MSNSSDSPGDSRHPDDMVDVPPAPIDSVLNPIVRFMHVEAAGGIVLLLATLTALVLANSPASSAFLGFWHTQFTLRLGSFQFAHPLLDLINDGLMAIFFFVVGMEVKREIALGELRSFKRAALPIAAALGGMLVPAAIYLSMQWGKPAEHGWGIPMATDIAFVVGCMAILGRRVPHGLRVMLLTLAIADDIGAILVIAVGYSSALHWPWLAAAAAAILLILLFRRIGIRSYLAYFLAGIFLWYAILESGIHATIAGVILGLMTPAHPQLAQGALAKLLDKARTLVTGEHSAADYDHAQHVIRFRRLSRETISPLDYLVHMLHPWVSFIIMPLFALANAGVPFQTNEILSPVALAVLLALLIGKPVGVFLSCLAAVKSGLAQLPDGVSWPRLAGGGLLCGIGFTMSLFIAGLALTGETLDAAKVGILAGSLVSAIVGMVAFLLAPPPASNRT